MNKDIRYEGENMRNLDHKNGMSRICSDAKPGDGRSKETVFLRQPEILVIDDDKNIPNDSVFITPKDLT